MSTECTELQYVEDLVSDFGLGPDDKIADLLEALADDEDEEGSEDDDD
jgi:hypothetical protein